MIREMSPDNMKDMDEALQEETKDPKEDSFDADGEYTVSFKIFRPSFCVPFFTPSQFLCLSSCLASMFLSSTSLDPHLLAISSQF